MPWVWKKGSDQIGSWGNFGVMGLPAPGNEPFSRTLGSTFTDINGNLWLFGGMTWLPAPQSWHFNDLWKYDPLTNNWTWMKGSDDVNQAGTYIGIDVYDPVSNPGSREIGASWTDQQGNFWIFGGFGFDWSGTYGALNDLWKFEVTSNTWIWINGPAHIGDRGNYGSKGVSSPSNLPPSRGSCTFWIDSNNDLWLFGGVSNFYSHYSDLWRYNIADNEWTWINGASTSGIQPDHGAIGISSPDNTPGSRILANSWIDANDDFFLFGGTTDNLENYSDLWKYSKATDEWTWIKGSSQPDQPPVRGGQGIPSALNQPGARIGGSSFRDSSGNFWLFGGVGQTFSPPGNELLNDLWKYSPATNQWAWMKGGEYAASGIYFGLGSPCSKSKPGGRLNAMSWIGSTGKFWLFGGHGYDKTGLRGELNDLWMIDPNVTVLNIVSDCSNYNWNGNVFSSSGVYADTLVSVDGCDSILILNLTIDRPQISSITTVQSCRAFEWNGQTYSVAGTYSDTLVAANGCDSIAILNLIITNAVINSSTSISACGPYTWNGQTYSVSGSYSTTLLAANGCDSVAKLLLSIDPYTYETIDRTICADQQFEGYISQGIYRDTFSLANGCDSIRILRLTVTPKPEPDLGAERNFCAGDVLILNPGHFDNYLWQDGSTQSTFRVNMPGLYRVTVDNNCGSTTDEILVKEGRCDIWFPTAFTPNGDGKNDFFTAAGDARLSNFYLSIYNRWGEKVFETNDQMKGWNGRYKGQLPLPGVYIWNCSYTKRNGPASRELKGTILLIR